MTPFPPSAIVAVIWSSLPDQTLKSSPHRLRIRATWEMLPLASFTPLMFG